jgi:hypothetical protein
MGDATDYSNDPGFAEAVAAAVAKEREAAEQAAQRKKNPKDFAEAEDRIARRVWEMFREEADARRKAEAGDEPPTRSENGSGSGFLGTLIG